MQALQDGVARALVCRLRPIDECADVILGGQRNGDNLAAHRCLTLADAIEERLELMSERGDLLEAEHGTRALDRVERTERAVDELLVCGLRLEIEQRLLETVEQL